MAGKSIENGEIEIGELVKERIAYQGKKRLANVHGVVGRAAAMELEGKEVPAGEPDHDWSARFFNDVQDVSSEDMQILWAKVLAGEVKRPGSTSVRTLARRSEGHGRGASPTVCSTVALTVCGRELSMVVGQKPMPEYTAKLKEFYRKERLRMVPVAEAEKRSGLRQRARTHARKVDAIRVG